MTDDFEVEIDALEEAVASGGLVKASDLLPPAEEEIPPTPEDSEPPEGDWVGQFHVGKDYRSVHIVHEDDAMEPLGLFLAREMPTAKGGEIAAWLEGQGLPQKSAVWYGKQRTQAANDEGPDVIVIPDDIEEVWGQGKLDGTGLPAINTARVLIAKWGIETFRTSAIHKAALGEIQHVEQKDEFAKAYLAAQKKKEK